MAKYCAKCLTFVPEGDVCPRCNNNVLTDVNKKPEKVKPKKKQTSLTEGSKKKKSPLVWVALGICVALAMVLVAVLSNAYSYSKGLEYTLLDDGTYAVTWWGDWNGSALNIPPTYEGKPVTSIGACAFSHCDKLKAVKIPDSVTSIGAEAFNFCSNLTEVNIPDGVTYIGAGAFSYCGRLTDINVDEDNPHYTSEDGVLFTKDKTQIAAYPAGKNDSTYSIPYGVTSIGKHAFSYCDRLTEVNIPGSVTSIEEDAFSRCYSLRDVNIPGSVSSIGDWVFGGCNSLTDIYYIGTEAEWNQIEIGGFAFPDEVTVHFSE